MKTLTRPMFNMGGPIKQGIMHGIREPKKHGGTSGVGHGLVGDKRYPKTKGREHHWAFLPYLGAAAMRLGPAAYRGWKAAKYFQPGKLGAWGRAKSMFGLGKGLGAPMAKPGAGAGFRIGSFAKQNPLTTFGIASSIPQAGYAGAKLAKEAPGGAWSVAKRYADAVIPGDQSRWWKDKEPPTGVPLSPNIQKKVAAAEELAKKKTKEFALQQRNDRVEKYLKMMGYDRAKKTAIADALIDASKIVSDRGTLDRKNITAELINPIIQATSKRLDKPDQIREAVGLMATKAEIEKDLEDPSIKALRLEQLKGLRGSFAKSIGDFILSAKGTKVKPEALKRYARAKADEHNLDFTVVTDADMAGVGEGASEQEIIQSVVKGDGVYMIGDALVQVTDGVPKQIA